MNILFILDAVAPYDKGGGGARISSSLIVKYVSKSYKCLILTQKFQKKSWKLGNVNVYPTFPYYFPKFDSLKDTILHGVHSTFSFPYYFKIKDFLKTHDIDLIHIESNNIPLIRAAIATNKPIVIDVRDTYFTCPIMFKNINHKHKHSFINCFLCRLQSETKRSPATEILRPVFVIYESINHKIQGILLKNCINKNSSKAVVVALSNYIKNTLIEYGISKAKIHVIYNISNIDDFKKVKATKKYKIVYGGILEKTKGIWDAIKAFELLNDQNLIFDIAGDGPELESIKKYIKNNKINNINLLGKVPYEKMPKLYNESLIILAPSIWPEPFGRFIQESRASKTPLITTNVGGIPEGVENRVTGILVKPSNPEQLSKAIKELLTNKNLYKRIVHNLEAKVYEFSPEVIGKQRIDLYKTLIKYDNK